MAKEKLDDDLAAVEADGPEVVEDDDLEELDGEEVGVDDDVVDDEVVDDEVAEVAEVDVEADVEVPVDPASTVKVPRVKTTRDEDEDDDEEEEEDSDDVEASLDVILKERLVVSDDEEEEEEVVDTEERGEAAPKVLPKQPGEFVCQSCFLVKHPSQLADRDAMFCRDCV